MRADSGISVEHGKYKLSRVKINDLGIKMNGKFNCDASLL